MTRKHIVSLLALFLSLAASSQRSFMVPSYFHGIFSDQLSSARAQGMGYTTITLDGVATSIYNPATISPGETTVDLALNYSKGNPQFPKSKYPFAGLSYKVRPRLTIGGSVFSWIDPDSYWTASIQGEEIDTDKKTQQLYSLVAAYEVKTGLHIGVSGNFLRGSSVQGTTTTKDFLLNTGLIYTRPMTIVKNSRLTNQNIRLAASLTNTLMKAISEERYQNLLNYRDIPIILRGGGAYTFSVPISAPFVKKSKFFSSEPEILDLALRLQYQNWLNHKDYIYYDHRYSTAFGIGTEAWFMKMLAVRLGYYSETRPAEGNSGEIIVTEPRKRGLTWGLGANLPLQRLSGGKVPLAVEVNLVTQRMMNEVKDEYVPSDSDFRDRRFQFCLGLNVRWNGEKR